MAKGDARVQQSAQQRAEQQAKNMKPRLFVGDGEKVIVRFLEQGEDKHNFALHEYFANVGGERKRKTFTCLNDAEDGTPCPGCQEGLKRRLRGVYNVIQRNRPQLKRGPDGYAVKDAAGQWIIEGYKDEVVIFDCSETSANLIREKDAKYNGLMSRDIEISRTGVKFNPFNFEPADIDAGAVPMSDADQALAANKFDLNEYMAPPSFSEAAQIVASQKAMQGGNQGGGQAQQPQSQPDPQNPFLATQAPQNG